MQLDAETYQSDGEDHPTAGAIARTQRGQNEALKSRDFKTTSVSTFLQLQNMFWTLRRIWEQTKR